MDFQPWRRDPSCMRCVSSDLERRFRSANVFRLTPSVLFVNLTNKSGRNKHWLVSIKDFFFILLPASIGLFSELRNFIMTIRFFLVWDYSFLSYPVSPLKMNQEWCSLRLSALGRSTLHERACIIPLCTLWKVNQSNTATFCNVYVPSYPCWRTFVSVLCSFTVASRSDGVMGARDVAGSPLCSPCRYNCPELLIAHHEIFQRIPSSAW